MRDNSNPERNKIPEEKIEAARPQIVKLAKLGCTDMEIGSIVGFSEDSVKRHCRAELDEGRGTLRRSLRKAQLEAAVNEKNATMLIWLGKCYLGQKEPKKELEHSGAINVEKVMFGKGDSE
jgi:hypothetical protein